MQKMDYPQDLEEELSLPLAISPLSVGKSHFSAAAEVLKKDTFLGFGSFVLFKFFTCRKETTYL